MAGLVDFYSVAEFSTQFLWSAMDGLGRPRGWNDFGFIIFSYSKFNASFIDASTICM
jgi:hypothetical protein